MGDRAAEALAADDDAVAVNYAGRENLGKWAAASEAIARLNRVKTLVSALIKLRGENMYTYLGALVWADLTYEQERELFERYRNQLEFRSNRGYLGVWHVLLGGYPSPSLTGLSSQPATRPTCSKGMQCSEPSGHRRRSRTATSRT